MKLEFYHPRMYMSSPQIPTTMGFAFTLTEPVDGDALREAANYLRYRFPYYYVQPKVIDTSIFPVLNPRPVVVRSSWEPTMLCSKEVNYHMMSFKYEGNRLAVEICHALTDGSALFNYAKSLLYCYLTRVTGKQFDPTGFRLPPLPFGVVPESEHTDPWAKWESAIDNAQQPETEKFPNLESYQINELPADGKRRWEAINIRLPEDQVMALCKKTGATPNALMSVLLTRAVHRHDPSNEKTVSTLVAVDPKAILGAEDSYYNCVSHSFVEFPGNHTYDDIREMCVDARAQISAQTQKENVLFKLKGVKDTFEQMKDLEVQEQMKSYSAWLNLHFATFAVSYVRARTLGPLDEYIKEMYVLDESSVTDVMVEMACLNNSFFLGFYQDEGSDAYFAAFLAELEAVGIPYEIMRKEPLGLCGVRYDGVENLDSGSVVLATENFATETKEAPIPAPRRSVAFICSECYPFVKTGGLGDVMYALPRALSKLNCDVRVILPRYHCIPQKYQEMMNYKGDFTMDLCADGQSFYVGIMELEMDGVVYDFIDNDDFFTLGNPYTELVWDIPKYCYFDKAALAALNYLDWTPDIVHCHDWHTGLVPVYLRTLFAETPVGRAKSMITIHNLRFQGIYDIHTIKYWSGLPSSVFSHTQLTQDWQDANMLKGGLTFADCITTVSGTYAGEIQTEFFGEGLDAHLRHLAWKLRGIVNGIDVDFWNSETDRLLSAPYTAKDAVEKKKLNKRALQERLGLAQNDGKMVIGLISRLTDQHGLDLINSIFPQLLDGNTQVVIMGTGDKGYEEAFRMYESSNKGTVCANIAYDESLARQIYAGADAVLMPSLFEPCGLTQLIAMRYGTVPIVRETGSLKDTVEPYNKYENSGNGFTFDRYEAGLLLNAINRAKNVYFTQRERWDEMVVRNMEKDTSWDNSARQYRELYMQLRPAE